MQRQRNHLATLVEKQIFSRQVPKAIQILKQAIWQGIECDQPFMGLGSLEDQQGFYRSYVLQWLNQQLKNTAISAYDYLCFCLTYTKSNEEGEAFYHKLIARHPNDYKAIYGLGTVYSNTGRYTKALQQYKTIIDMGVKLDKVYQQIAFIAYFHQHQLEVAKQYLRMGLALNKKNLYFKFLKILVEQPFQHKNQLLEKLYKENPSYTRILNNIANNLIIAERYDSAVQYLQRCMKQDKLYSTPYFNMSLICQKRKQIQNSISYLKKCCQLDPQFRYGQVMIGRLYYEYLKQYSLAEKYLRQGLMYEKSQLAASFELGKMNNFLKRFQQASLWFQQCIKINPKVAYFYRSLGIVLENRRQFERAIKQYEQSRMLNSHCQISLIGLADCHYYCNNYDMANKYYAQARNQSATFGFSEKSYLNYVNVLISKEKISDTIDILEQAIRAYPDRLIFLTTIGHIYLRLQQYRSAEKAFEVAREKYQLDKPAYDNEPIEEEAAKQIYNYCGLGEDWLKKKSLGILSIKNQIVLNIYKNKYFALFMKLLSHQTKQILDLY